MGEAIKYLFITMFATIGVLVVSLIACLLMWLL